MNLNEAQNLFRKNVLAPQADPQAVQNLKPAGHLSLDQAFEIYHRSYFARLTAILARTYQAVHWVVGEDLFRTLCHKFIETQPSVNYNLLSYGRNFPEFLKVNPAARSIPFLFDLARFEWAYKEIYHGPTPTPLPVERVQELLRAEDFRIQFIEALEVFTSPYAIYEIWYRREEPPYRFEDIDWNHPESLLIYKKQGNIQVQQIDDLEADILLELKNGSSISSALGDFSSLLTPDRIAQFFQMLMKAGLVDDILILEN